MLILELEVNSQCLRESCVLGPFEEVLNRVKTIGGDKYSMSVR